MAADHPVSTSIPKSEIRSLYNFLRESPRTILHLKIAEAIQQNTEPLSEMLSVSFGQCLSFNNRDQRFHNGRGNGETKFTAEVLNSKTLANRVLVQLPDCGPDQGFPFTFVDYELSPFRVAKNRVAQSQIPKKQKKFKKGRIDVLMHDGKGTPIIGEIKAEKDTNLLVALIQSLAGAVEFATPNQRARLEQAYKVSDGSSVFSEVSRVGVCLLQALPPQDECSQAISKAVEGICRKLMESQATLKIINRITCLKTAAEEGERLKWTPLFNFPSQAGLA
jgi:hypothetical protein